MHEYGVTIDQIWNQWTSAQVAAMTRKARQRHAIEQKERINATSIAMIDVSKNPTASSYLKSLEAQAAQYAPSAEDADITEEQAKRFNIVDL